MSKTQWSTNLRQWGQKLSNFKYPLLIFGLGLLLVAIPTKKQTEKQQVPAVAEAAATASNDLRATEEKLENILSQIEGAGHVQVMLQYLAGEKTLYQLDVKQEVDTESESKRTQTESTTVLASGAASKDTPVVMQTIYPTYQGALIVCAGADSATVRLNLVNAVSGLTGLGADKITVVKMKSE